MLDDHNLPAARLVPRDGADRRALLRAEAADQARKAGRVAVSVTKGVALLALCGLGLGVLAAGAGSHRYQTKELDRSLQRIRSIQLDLSKYRSVDFEQLRRQVDRDLQYPRPVHFGTLLGSEDRHAQ